MSWRSHKSDRYNRPEVKEELDYWLQLFNDEAYEGGDDDWWWNDPWFSYHHMSGYVHDMDAYHQMKMLTLLRGLNIRTATDMMRGNGW